MPLAPIVDEYVHALLAGKRAICRELVQRELNRTSNPRNLYEGLLWPALEHVDKLYRQDRINTATQSMATRINRCVADQLQLSLERDAPNGKRIVISCADGEPEELSAQMIADLFEANGWDVYFVGGGVPNDEILNLVGQLRPDLLLVFGTKPAGVPGVRRLIDLVRSVNPAPTMNIMVTGGIFNRADGLWKEVNADFTARTGIDALSIAESAEPRAGEVQAAPRPKRRRRRRRTEAAVAVG